GGRTRARGARGARAAAGAPPGGDPPPREGGRVAPGAAGRIQHGVCPAAPPQQPCRRGQVYRPPVSKRVVVEHPVVVGGEHLIGASHKIAVCQTPPENPFCPPI